MVLLLLPKPSHTVDGWYSVKTETRKFENAPQIGSSPITINDSNLPFKMFEFCGILTKSVILKLLENRKKD